MGNPWLDHLKAFHKANPSLSYKEAMKTAKKTYKRVSDAVKKSPSKKSPSKKSPSKKRRGRSSKKSRKSRKSKRK